MQKYLTQGEIDAILQYVKLEQGALADSSVKAGSIVTSHDFTAPTRVSKDVMRSIFAIHETFLYSLVSTLSARMRTIAEVELVGIDQMSYQEYILSLNNPTVLCVASMSPLDGEAVIEFHPGLVSCMIDLLFGGEGEFPSRVRELTPIEQSVFSRIVNTCTGDLGRAWREIQELEFTLKNIERNPQFLQVLSPSEVVILVTFEVKLAGSVGLMSICYPMMVLEPALESIEEQRSSSRVKPWRTETGENPLQQEMLGVNVPVVAELGRSALSVRELLDLEEGDVLRLDGRYDEPIRVNVGGATKLRGLPGLRKNHLSVLVTDTEEGVDDVRAETNRS